MKAEDAVMKLWGRIAMKADTKSLNHRDKKGTHSCWLCLVEDEVDRLLLELNKK